MENVEVPPSLIRLIMSSKDQNIKISKDAEYLIQKLIAKFINGLINFGFNF